MRRSFRAIERGVRAPIAHGEHRQESGERHGQQHGLAPDGVEEVQVARVVNGDGHDDHHDQGMADEVNPPEGIDGGCENQQQAKRRETPQQRRGEKAEAQGKFRNASHRNEGIAVECRR